MNTLRLYLTLTLGTVALTGMAALPNPQNKPETPGWETDFNKARITAQQANKPLFVVFR
jgi:hypothetical protein